MKKILSNAVTVFVLVIVLLLIIPLNPFLMDILIIINIAISMVVLIISMNIREPLELSTFPSLCIFHKEHSDESGTVRAGYSGVWYIRTSGKCCCRFRNLFYHRISTVYCYYEGCGACC